MEKQLQTHDLFRFVMLPLDFWKPQARLAETLEELNILKNLICGLREYCTATSRSVGLYKHIVN